MTVLTILSESNIPFVLSILLINFVVINMVLRY